MKRIIVAIVVAVFWTSASLADKGVVVAECNSHYLLQTAAGYTLAEWYGGNIPDKGQTIVGEIDRYGMKKAYNISTGHETSLWVDDYGMSKDDALEKFYSQC